MPSSTGTLVFNDQKIQAPDIYATESLGVGVSDPTSNLQVVGNAYVSSNLEVGTANLFVDTTTGRVGVGTDSPIRSLDARSGDGETSSGWISGVFGPKTGLSTNPRIVAGCYSNVAILGAHSGTLNAWSDLYLNRPDNPVVVDTTGNVGIGTTNPSAKLDVNGYIKNTNPVFYARRNSVQNTGVYVFNIQELDSHNAYDPTNGRFTAPIAGRYVFNVFMLTNGNTAAFPEFRKNGSRVFNASPYTDANGSYACVAGTIVLELALNDYVDINVINGALYGGGNDHNGFCGYMIG